MFERTRIERSGGGERTATVVEVLLVTGQSHHGRIFHATTRALSDELNGEGVFVDFESSLGERMLLSKRSIQSVRPKQLPKTDQLSRAQVKGESFNPWEVLAVPECSSRNVVREAYHRLIKLYHPDRFACAELPPEVAGYLKSMAHRINAAYAEIGHAAPPTAAPEAARL
jgi:hypothetical protein